MGLSTKQTHKTKTTNATSNPSNEVFNVKQPYKKLNIFFKEESHSTYLVASVDTLVESSGSIFFYGHGLGVLKMSPQCMFVNIIVQYP